MAPRQRGDAAAGLLEEPEGRAGGTFEGSSSKLARQRRDWRMPFCRSLLVTWPRRNWRKSVTMHAPAGLDEAQADWWSSKLRPGPQARCSGDEFRQSRVRQVTRCPRRKVCAGPGGELRARWPGQPEGVPVGTSSGWPGRLAKQIVVRDGALSEPRTSRPSAHRAGRCARRSASGPTLVFDPG